MLFLVPPPDLSANFTAGEVTRTRVGRRNAIVRVNVDVCPSVAHRGEKRHTISRVQVAAWSGIRRTVDAGRVERPGGESSVLLYETRRGECGTGRCVRVEPLRDRTIRSRNVAVDVSLDDVTDIRRDEAEVDHGSFYTEDRLPLRRGN